MSTEDTNSNNKRQTKIWFTAIAGALVLALAIVGVLFLTGTIVPNTQTHSQTSSPATPSAATGGESETKTAEPTVDPETQKLVDAGKALDKKKVILTGEDGCTVKGDMLFFGKVSTGKDEILLLFGDLDASVGSILPMAVGGQTNMKATVSEDGSVYPTGFATDDCDSAENPTVPIKVLRDLNESDYPD